MTVPTAERPPRGRTDLSGLPSGTTVRFVLLIVAVATAAAVLGNGLSSMIFTTVDLSDVADYYDCAVRATEEAARRRAGEPGVSIPPVFEFDCSDPRAGTSWAVPVVTSGCLLLVVLGVYASLPAWRTWRRGYRPLTGMPQVSDYVQGLVRETGVRPRVAFLAEPLNPRIAALAFGRVRQRRVVLSGGLLTLYSLDRRAFRTVVLHELAHIRNHDLDIAFLTLIVWRTVGPPLLIASLLGALASPLVVVEMPAATAADLTFTAEAVLLATLVTLLKSSVLRSRELYADARVRSWEGSADSLRRLFAGYGQPFAPPSGGRFPLLRVHPPLPLRVRALDDDRVLTGVGFWDMFAVGAAVASLHGFLTLGPIGGGTLAGAAIDVVADAVATTLLIGAAGAVLWRAAARPPDRGAPVRAGRAGIALGLGLCASCLLSPSGAFSLASLNGKGIAMAFPFAALLCLCGWALTRWLTLVARSWTPVVFRNGRPGLVFCAVLAVCIAGLVSAFDFLMTLPAMTLYAASFIAPSHPPVLVFVGSVGYLAVSSTTFLLTTLTLTAALVPLVGQRVAWRKGMQHTFTEFGPPRPAAGVLARFGVPAGLGAAFLGVLLPVLGIPFSVWSLITLMGMAQAAAALWAGRGCAPLPLPRGLIAAYSAGVLTLLAWTTGVEALTSCLPAEGPCRPLPGYAHIRLAITVAAPGAATAWLLHAALLALTRRPKRHL
ncbi:M48 family metalloprotease [Streptomyces sp. NPDC056237]|uniref:M48 family metalloprotease n=1 Tax=Streptomyces sp. NPDC056237 TaxID=3345758 RepID=UPI0035DF1015